jgi:DNA replication protein DnaC
MLFQFNAARAANGFDRQFAKLTSVDLLIIDEFGLKPLKGIQDEDFHDVIAERYERKSTIVTSNLDIPEWPEAFANRILSAATIDRLRHGAYKAQPQHSNDQGSSAGLLFKNQDLLHPWG